MTLQPHKHRLFIFTIIAGSILIRLLSDRIVSSDAADLFRNSVNLFESGSTGYQFRNILFSYILAVPLFLSIDVTGFALFLSLLSVIACTTIIYSIVYPKTGGTIAAFSAAAFILSFPVLRYATQVNSDIPALALIAGTLYCSWLVLDKNKIRAIPLVYFFGSFSVSLRYGSVFIAPALLYFFWVTKKRYLFHLAGIVLGVIPIIPQLIYNSHYLSSIYSISYSELQPTLALRHFFQESNQGLHFQLLHYIKNTHFSFRGIPVYFLPLTITGIVESFGRFSPFYSRFLIIFHLAFLILLSFFAGFENRYALGALLPCFIWLALGTDRLYSLVKKSSTRKIVFLTWITGGLYCSFEIGFHIIQSSRAIHQARFDIIEKTTALLNSSDIVCTELDNNYCHPRIKTASFNRKKINYYPFYDTLRTIEPHLAGGSFYCIFPTSRWLSEGQVRHSGVNTVTPARFTAVTIVDSCSSGDITELGFYRLLRILHREHMIPRENWLLVRMDPSADTAGSHCDFNTFYGTAATPENH